MTAGEALSPELLLYAYGQGVFPMAERRDDPDVFWVDPERRGILPLDGFHVSRSLARRLRSGLYRVTVDQAFRAVMRACADRPETWISPAILRVYGELHDLGHGHSVEVWQGERLVGGVYGVALGAAFFGESMFSRAVDASKVALAYLVDRLRVGGFALFDTQFLTPHLASLGGIEMGRAAFHRLLRAAVTQPANFDAQGPVPSPYSVIQRIAHTS